MRKLFECELKNMLYLRKMQMGDRENIFAKEKMYGKNL